MAASLHNLGITALNLLDMDRAEALCAEGRAPWREVGDDRGVAISLNSSAILAPNRGDHERARACYDESLALFRKIGDTWGMGLVVNNLARVERDLENWDRVAALAGREPGAVSGGRRPARRRLGAEQSHGGCRSSRPLGAGGSAPRRG